MSARGLLLEGEVMPHGSDESLQLELEDLKRQLASERADAAEARRSARQSIGAIQELQRQLTPLFRALQMVFGEIDAVASAPASAAAPLEPGSDQKKAVWEAWKTRLGGGAAKIIDALMLHGELGVVQLKITCQMANQTVYDNISKMNKAGLINKNGGKYSLKIL